MKPSELVAFLKRIHFSYSFSEMLHSNMQIMHYPIRYAQIYNISVTEIWILIKSGLKLVFDIVEILESKVFTEAILDISFLTSNE